MLLGSSNDYCGVYNTNDANGNPVAAGPIWLGYYRSQDAGSSWVSSLVPGYPGDTSPYAQLAQIRTASAGDPVIAWDNHGRAFFGSESSGDPAGTAKGFGDQWVARFVNPDGPDAPTTARDGLKYEGTTTVARGSSSPLLGQVQRQDGDRGRPHRHDVRRQRLLRLVALHREQLEHLLRALDRPRRHVLEPALITSSTKNVQDPEIAVTGNGHVYVTWDQGIDAGGQPEGVGVAKSTNCGATFSPGKLARRATTATRSATSPAPAAMPQPQAQHDDASRPTARLRARPPATAATSPTRAHRATRSSASRRSTRTTADQKDAAHEWLYVTYAAIKPGPVVPTGTTYGNVDVGQAGQTQVYFLRYDGASGQVDLAPKLVDPQARGDQLFSDVAIEGGVAALRVVGQPERRVLRRDAPDRQLRRPARPSVTRRVRRALHRPRRDDHGPEPAVDRDAPIRTTSSSTTARCRSRVTTSGSPRSATSRTRPGRTGATRCRARTRARRRRTPTRRRPTSLQCRDTVTTTGKKGATSSAWSSDRCPHAGGLDQNIYGAATP